MTIFIAAVLCALGISAACSVLEACLLSLTPAQVAQMSQKHPRRGAIWLDFKNRIDRPIAAILILNTAAHTIGATVAGAQFELVYGHNGLLMFSIVFTFLMLQFTEILPKTLGVRFNHYIAPLIALPLRWLVRAFQPMLFVIRLINRPFEQRSTGPKPRAATLEEISTLAGMARIANLIGPQQERIIRETPQLSRKQASDLMVPVAEIGSFNTRQTLGEAFAASRHARHTRYPLFRGEDPDTVLGYVNFKELVFQMQGAEDQPLESIPELVRPVPFVAPGDTAEFLLRMFVVRRSHLAIVRDDNGATLGLVTLEDVMEELVGEIEDEFD